MNNKSRRGLRFWFISRLTLMGCVLGGALIYLSAVELKQSTITHHAEKGMALAQNLAKNSEYGFITADQALLKELIYNLKGHNDVVYVKVGETGQRGERVLASFSEEAYTPAPLTKAPSVMTSRIVTAQNGEMVIDIVAPITTHVKKLSEDSLFLGESGTKPAPPQPVIAGYVQMGVSVSHGMRDIKRTTIRVGLIIILLITAFAISHYWYITRIVINPLRRVVSAMEKVGKGDMDFRIAPESHMEIAELADGFNLAVEERKTALQGLVRSEERYRTLLEKYSDGVAVIRDDDIVYANAVLGGILGYSSAAMFAHRSILQMVVPDEREKVAMELIRLKENEQATTFRSWMLRKDGGGQPVEISFRDMDYMGEKAIFAVVRDISNILKVEEERVRLFTALEQIDDMLVITGDNGEIRYVNPAFERASGIPAPSALEKSVVSMFHDGAGGELADDVRKAMKAGAAWSGKATCNRANGEKFPAHVTLTPIYDHQSRIINFVIVTRDISKATQLEAQLLQKQKMEAIGALAGGIAHDFNNILMGILGLTSLAIMEVSPKDPVMAKLLKMQEAGDRAKNLVNQILDFSRIGRQEKSAVNIALIVEEAISLQTVNLPQNTRIERSVEPECWVMGVAAQIHQVASNLISNAEHAIKENGVIRVTLRAMEVTTIELLRDYYLVMGEMADGKWLRLSVEDTGCGMDPKIVDRIFEPFFTTRKGGRGTGLGLATTLGIVKSHNGVIAVRSVIGKGSEFTVLLPMATRPEKAGILAKKTEYAIPVKLKVLLVEDDDFVAEILDEMFRKHAYDVMIAVDATTALNFFTTDPDWADIVITDYSMPGMNGVDMAAEILRIRPETPVIISSAFSDEGVMDKAKKAGVREILRKPYTSEEINDAIRRNIRERRA